MQEHLGDANVQVGGVGDASVSPAAVDETEEMFAVPDDGDDDGEAGR